MRLRRIVVLLIALGMLAAGCGGDDDGASEDSRKVSGTGYEVTLPDGWMDRTKDTEGSIINVDLLLVRRGGLPTTSVNVLRETVGDAVGNDELSERFRGQLGAVGARDITPARPAELDDEEAFTYTYVQRSTEGAALRGRQVALVRDGHAYTITLAAGRARFAAANAQFDQMLSSWQWK